MADTETSTDVTINSPDLHSAGRACLVLISAPQASDIGAVFTLDHQQTIGRGADAAVQIEDNGVSRAHARILRGTDGSFTVEDLDSRNGTYINGVKMGRAVLNEGDRVQIGSSTVLRFTTRDEPIESSLQLRQALAAARVATFQLDVPNLHVKWSEHLDTMLGAERGTLSGQPRPLLELVHALDRERVGRTVKDAAQSGRLIEAEFRIDLRGEIRWLSCKGDVVRDGTGAPVRITGTVMDVTVKKRAEEELGRQALIFENLYDGVVTTDLKGEIVDWNMSAERMFGHARGEVLGRTLTSVLRPSEAVALMEVILQRISREGRWTGELEYARKDGTTGFCEAVLVPLRDPGGQRLGIIATHRDISERKRLQAQLLLAERLASVGTLAAGVAHEINNPLAYISANIEFVLNEVERADLQPARIKELAPSLRESLEGARRIAIIVRDLKTFSRGGANEGPVESVDVQKVLELACKMANNLVRHRARLLVDCEPVRPVLGNEGRLCQVFLNLLVNAAEAVPETGAGHPEIRVSVRAADAEHVSVEVRDTGSGMAPETLARIFDPFFTTKPFGVGTGLGLSICHGIITALGGRIQVESEVGKGSLFRVLLRAADQESRPAAAARSVAAGAQRRQVLLIDDEPNVTLALQRVLGLSHEVFSVNRASDGLDLIAAGQRFDIILCDVMMPEMSGVELHAALQRKVPEQAEKLVFMTGGAFAPITRAQLDALPNIKLSKPLEIQEVLALVDRAGAPRRVAG